MTDKQYRNYKCTLCTESLEKAKRELREDPETRSIELDTLRERLQRYPGLKARVDDVFLLKFLRARKFDQERAFELVINHYRSKQTYSEMFIEMNPRSCHSALESGVMCSLPHRTKNGEAIVIGRLGIWDPLRVPIDDINKVGLMIFQQFLESEDTQVNGVIWIGDLTGFSWEHAKTMTPSIAKKMMELVQDSFPVRIKGIHYVNEPALFDAVFAILRPFLKEKLKKRVHFHGQDVKSLHEFIDPEFLPEEYGGKLPPLTAKDTNEKLRKRQAQFEEDLSYGFVNMKLQNAKHKSSDALETMSGTFKKLSTD